MDSITNSSRSRFIGASNLCRRKNSHLAFLEIPSKLHVLDESGESLIYTKAISNKSTLDSLLFHALRLWICTFIFIFPDYLYNPMTAAQSKMHFIFKSLFFLVVVVVKTLPIFRISIFSNVFFIFVGKKHFPHSHPKTWHKNC